MGLTTPSYENLIVQKSCKGCRTDLGRRSCKRNKDKNMALATWNVRSLYRPGALAKLNDELNKYGIAIAAIQEIRWSGSEIFDSGEFIVCYSGNKEGRQFGTGFLINKNINILLWALAQKQTAYVLYGKEAYTLIPQ
jgi:hypothetical protein